MTEQRTVTRIPGSLLIVAATMMVAYSLYFGVFGATQLGEVFQDFGGALPAPTLLLLKAPFLPLLGSMAALGVAIAAVVSPYRIVVVAAFAIVLFVACAIVVPTLLPLLALMRSIGVS